MKVAVIFGGTSQERDVSMASGIQVFSALKSIGCEVILIDANSGIVDIKDIRSLANHKISATPPKFTSPSKNLKKNMITHIIDSLEFKDIDIAFIALHGEFGEDGMLQILFESLKIPFTGTGHIGSVLAMNKDIAKHLMTSVGVTTPPWQMCQIGQIVKNQLGWPVIVKPNSQGSTIGLSLVWNEGELKKAISKAREYDDEVMLEKYIKGRELTVSILDNKPLTVGEIIVTSEIFDYQSKYQENGAIETFPANISNAKTKTIQQLAMKVNHVLKLEHFSRIDFIMEDEGQLWCLEANSIPGLTAKSLLPQSAQASGIDFASLCKKICDLGIKRSRI